MNEKIQLSIESVEYIAPGEQVASFLPGDFILTHDTSIFSRMIRFGQGLRFRGDSAQYAYWSHAALISDTSGNLIEAVGEGVCLTHLDKYRDVDYTIVRISALDIDREQAVTYASRCIGRKYGWIHLASLSLSLLSGLTFSFGFDTQLICSGLVATALERTSAVFDRDASHILPADLARYYNVVKR
jgi:uncharacterized protein YycO